MLRGSKADFRRRIAEASGRSGPNTFTLRFRAAGANWMNAVADCFAHKAKMALQALDSSEKVCSVMPVPISITSCWVSAPAATAAERKYEGSGGSSAKYAEPTPCAQKAFGIFHLTAISARP